MDDAVDVGSQIVVLLHCEASGGGEALCSTADAADGNDFI